MSHKKDRLAKMRVGGSKNTVALGMKTSYKRNRLLVGFQPTLRVTKMK